MSQKRGVVWRRKNLWHWPLMTDRHRELRIRYWMCLRKTISWQVFFWLDRKLQSSRSTWSGVHMIWGVQSKITPKRIRGCRNLMTGRFWTRSAIRRNRSCVSREKNQSSSGLRISVITRKCMIWLILLLSADMAVRTGSLLWQRKSGQTGSFGMRSPDLLSYCMIWKAIRSLRTITMW